MTQAHAVLADGPGLGRCTLLASPLTDGLFHAAIHQSGPCLNDIAIHDLAPAR
jgi:carboxylesterase type B